MRILVDVCVGNTTRDWLTSEHHDVAFVGDRNFSMNDHDVRVRKSGNN
jgi:predicted nuclease of predicted toxin-antitoxin system